MMFLGVPNTIDARLVEQTTRTILDQLERANDHVLVHRSDSPLRFSIISGFPPAIPYGEGIRVDRAFVFQVDIDHLPRLKALLSLANEKQVWKYVWGDYAQTVHAPTFNSPLGERENYQKLVKFHEVFQKSMVAVKIDGLVKPDFEATVSVTPHAKDKSKKGASILSVRNILRRMKINGLPLWECLSGSPESGYVGYYSKGGDGFAEFVACFVQCPGANVYKWMVDHRCERDSATDLISEAFDLDQLRMIRTAKLSSKGYAYIKGAKSSLHNLRSNMTFDFSALQMDDNTPNSDDIWASQQIGLTRESKRSKLHSSTRSVASLGDSVVTGGGLADSDSSSESSDAKSVDLFSCSNSVSFGASVAWATSNDGSSVISTFTVLSDDDPMDEDTKDISTKRPRDTGGDKSFRALLS